MNERVVDWLLEEENPSVRYRTMTELLDEPADTQAMQALREKIADSKPVARIFSKMHPDGYWPYYDKRTDRWFGDDVWYADYTTTHFNLAFLSELGVTREDPRVEKAANRYLDLQQSDGDFLKHFSCLYAYNLRTFLRMGFQEDVRVQKTKTLLLRSGRVDGGYLCELHEGKYKTKPVKSCLRGSVKALMAYAEMPDTWASEGCRNLTANFLQRRVLYRSNDLEKPGLKDLWGTMFPFVWRATLLEPLYALSVMGLGNVPELEHAWNLLDSKRDGHGKVVLDWSPPHSLFVPEKRGMPGKWVTLYACLAEKHRHRSPMSILEK